MEKYLNHVSESIRKASKKPGRLDLKNNILSQKLKNQINYVFENSIFQINIFYGQNGMGKRSFVQSAIDKSNFRNSIFFVQIDASFTRTEYLLLKEVFDTIEAESIVGTAIGETGDSGRKSGANQKINYWLSKGERNKPNEAEQIDEEKDSKDVEITNGETFNLGLYMDEEDEEMFREIDQQDVASQYSKLHGYMSSFDVVLYVQNADVFTRMKRQSFIYNILEMSKKHKAKGLVIFATEQLDFFESLEKRNASRMNPTKYVFGDFSYQQEFKRIIDNHFRDPEDKESETNKGSSSTKNRLKKKQKRKPRKNKADIKKELTMSRLLQNPAVQNQMQMCLLQDLTLKQTLSFFRAFIRHLDPDLFASLNKQSEDEIKELHREDLARVELAFEQARFELSDTSKYETYSENLNFTEKLLLMIINQYQLTFQTQGSYPIRVKNLETSIANYLRKDIDLGYKTSRDLIHQSIDNLERLGFLKISRKNMNLDTIVFGNIDPEFSEILSKDFKMYNLNSVSLNILDKK